MSHLDYEQKTVPTGGVSESPNDAEAYIFVWDSELEHWATGDSKCATWSCENVFTKSEDWL